MDLQRCFSRRRSSERLKRIGKASESVTGEINPDSSDPETIILCTIKTHEWYIYPQAPCVAQAQNSVNYKDFLFTLYISYKFSHPR